MLPLTLLDINDFKVFSMSSDSLKTTQSNLSIAFIKPTDPSCIKSLIVNTPDACCDVANLRAMFPSHDRRQEFNNQFVPCIFIIV
jgi:hypothetical protein